MVRKISKSIVSKVKDSKEPLNIAPSEKNENFVDNINNHNIEVVQKDT